MKDGQGHILSYLHQGKLRIIKFVQRRDMKISDVKQQKIEEMGLNGPSYCVYVFY